MTFVLGKDFKETIGYVPRLEHVTEKFNFKTTDSNGKAEQMRKANEALIQAGYGDMLVSHNKPEYGEGLWVSPCDGNFCAWGGACEDLGFDHYTDYYHKVIPHDDCRILILDSVEEYLKFEKYDFQWDIIAKDYDMVYVNSYEVMSPVMFMAGKDNQPKPKYHLMMYGWDCVSGVFLNKKFDIELNIKRKYNKTKSNRMYTDKFI